MKKPKIDMQSKRMMVDTKTYSEMIDALIEAYLLIDDMPIDEREERHLRTYNHIADALEKAGVE